MTANEEWGSRTCDDMDNKITLQITDTQTNDTAGDLNLTILNLYKKKVGGNCTACKQATGKLAHEHYQIQPWTKILHKS